MTKTLFLELHRFLSWAWWNYWFLRKWPFSLAILVNSYSVMKKVLLNNNSMKLTKSIEYIFQLFVYASHLYRMKRLRFWWNNLLSRLLKTYAYSNTYAYAYVSLEDFWRYPKLTIGAKLHVSHSLIIIAYFCAADSAGQNLYWCIRVYASQKIPTFWFCSHFTKSCLIIINKYSQYFSRWNFGLKHIFSFPDNRFY